jgi:hypothetical protein
VNHEGDVRGSDSCRDRPDHPAVQGRLVGLADRLLQPVERREWIAPLTEQATLQRLADASPHRLDQHHPDDGDGHRRPAILELVETFTDQEQGGEVHRHEEGCDEGSQGGVDRCPLHDHADVVELSAQHRETNDGHHDNRPHQQQQSAEQASRYQHRGEDEADVHYDVDLELTFLRRGCPVEPRRQTRRTEHGSTNHAEQEQRPDDGRERGDRTRRNALQSDKRSKHERNRDDAPQRDAKDERPSPGLLRSVRECLWKQRQGQQESPAHTDERKEFHRLPGRPSE